MCSEIKINKSIQLWLKIKKVLKEKSITQRELAKELKISSTALSLQFKSLYHGNGINTKTLEVIEKKTGVEFLKV